MPNVEEIVAKHTGLGKYQNVWFAPNIPSDVLSRASKHCPLRIQNDNLLFVVDDSMKGLLWGKTENFVLFTKDHIIGFGPLNECKINLSEITDVEIQDDGKDGFLFFLNKDYKGRENQCFGFWSMGQDFCYELTDLLNDLAKT